MNFPNLKQKSTGLVAVVAVASFIGAGCGMQDNNKNENKDSKNLPSQTDTQKEDTQTETPTTKSAATDTRVTLDRLLGEHAGLAMFATQKGLSGSPDFEAIAGALDQNSVELSEVIGSVYGPEAAKEFLDGQNQWRAHINLFVDYTVASAKKDKAGQDKAVQGLLVYTKEHGKFLGTATELPADAVQKDLEAHVLELKGQLDAYAAGDYKKAYTLHRQAYAHMFGTGDLLAGAIATQQDIDNGTVTEDAANTRVTLGRLLGEHAMLAQFATQKGLKGEKDFEAIAAALDQNSVDLSKVIASVYGEEAGKEFLDGENMWRDHITFFVDYTVATAKKDKAGQEQAVANLGNYINDFGSFLATATGLPEDAVKKDLTAHVTELKTQLDQYAAGDFEAAYKTERQAYTHMFATGDLLAEAIVAQQAGKSTSNMESSMEGMDH